MSRRQARQVVRHGHVSVNGRKVNIPSFQCKVGDEIAIREGSKALVILEESKNFASGQRSVAWLDINRDNLSGKVIALPKREDINLPGQRAADRRTLLEVIVAFAVTKQALLFLSVQLKIFAALKMQSGIGVQSLVFLYLRKPNLQPNHTRPVPQSASRPGRKRRIHICFGEDSKKPKRLAVENETLTDKYGKFSAQAATALSAALRYDHR